MNRNFHGYDYSFSRPSIAALRAAGASFVIRYLTGSGKAITRSEAAALKAVGIAVGLVYETTAARAGQGFAAGATDARIALAARRLLGLTDAAVIFAVDFDASLSQVTPYFRGVRAVMGFADTGVYGSYTVVKGLLENKAVKYGWQTIAWSRGQVYSGAHVFQHLPSRVGGASVDPNDASIEAFGAFSFKGRKPTPPPPRPLREGDSGSRVRDLQARLRSLGNPGLKVDGSFGPRTTRYVRNFQHNHHLTVDGIVGSATNKAINAAIKARRNRRHK